MSISANWRCHQKPPRGAQLTAANHHTAEQRYPLSFRALYIQEASTTSMASFIAIKQEPTEDIASPTIGKFRSESRDMVHPYAKPPPNATSALKKQVTVERGTLVNAHTELSRASNALWINNVGPACIPYSFLTTYGFVRDQFIIGRGMFLELAETPGFRRALEYVTIVNVGTPPTAFTNKLASLGAFVKQAAKANIVDLPPVSELCKLSSANKFSSTFENLHTRMVLSNRTAPQKTIIYVTALGDDRAVLLAMAMAHRCSNEFVKAHKAYNYVASHFRPSACLPNPREYDMISKQTVVDNSWTFQVLLVRWSKCKRGDMLEFYLPKNDPFHDMAAATLDSIVPLTPPVIERMVDKTFVLSEYGKLPVVNKSILSDMHVKMEA